VRTSAISSGAVRIKDIALRQPNWPSQTTQVGNAYENQFQLPILFYLLTILAWLTRQADLLFVILAWVFVALRLAHAYVHVTSNRVPRRFALFASGCVVLLVMWIIFAVRLLFGI
jgi:hypothetical protein